MLYGTGEHPNETKMKAALAALSVTNPFAATFVKFIYSKIPKSRSSSSLEYESFELKVWPSGGNSWSYWFFIRVDFRFIGELRIRYLNSFSSEKMMNLHALSSNVEDVWTLIEDGLSHLDDLLRKQSARDTKNKLESMGLQVKVDSLIPENKKDLIQFQKRDYDNTMHLSPKKKGNWSVSLKKHLSKKDTFSLRLKGNWKFDEENLLKLLEAFIAAIPEEKSSKK